VEDKQATRIAFTANAAIVPRNKFTVSDYPNAVRLNQYVTDSRINKPAGTILATEFLNKWEKMSVNASGGKKVKSHRPISPLSNAVGVFIPYVTPPEAVFWYGVRDDPRFGLVPKRDLGTAALFDSPVYNRANFIGRHHPGGDDIFGGTANGVYVDGHIERKTAYQSLKLREWGDRYWSVTGRSEVKMHSGLYKQTARSPWP
jgi:prepilin-type processing-associated H-X9-DG protein